MPTATATRPKTKKAERPKPASTGQIELDTATLIRVVSMLDHIRSHDDSRPVLCSLHLTTSDKGDKVTFEATDSYSLARVTVDCEATPRLDAMIIPNFAEVKSLLARGRGVRAATKTIVRIGQTGTFGLSAAGHWTGRGVHMADGERLAFGRVVASDIPFPDFDGLFARTSGAADDGPVAYSPQVMGRICMAANAWGKGRPVRFESIGSVHASRFTISHVNDPVVEGLLMPVRIS